MNELIPVLDPESPTPLYHQITLHLQSLVSRGILKPGDQLPTERLLADETGVSRMTVRQAMSSMVTEGWCERRRGRGIFVRNRPVIIDAKSFEGFTANMARQALSAKTVVLKCEVKIPPEWVTELIDLGDSGLSVEIQRLRVIGGNPAIFETEWFSSERFPGLETNDFRRSLYGILEKKYGVQIATTTDVLNAHLPSEEERRLLQIENVPVIVRKRVGQTEDGTPIEVVRSAYHPDRYEFRMTLVPAQRIGDQAAI